MTHDEITLVRSAFRRLISKTVNWNEQDVVLASNAILVLEKAEKAVKQKAGDNDKS